MANKALINALKVLLCFNANRPEWRVTDLSRVTGLEKSHIVKILQEFTEVNVLVQDPQSRRYRVGPRALALGSGYQTCSRLANHATGIMARLSGCTGYTTTLNTLDGNSVLFFLSIKGALAIDNNWAEGAHIPWHATAAGKIHAAFLQTPELNELLCQQSLPAITPTTIRDPAVLQRQIAQIRNQGYASTNGESTPGLGALAMPIFGDSLRFLGALSVLFPLNLSKPTRNALLVQLLEATGQLSRRMGAAHYPYHAASKI